MSFAFAMVAFDVFSKMTANAIAATSCDNTFKVEPAQPEKYQEGEFEAGSFSSIITMVPGATAVATTASAAATTASAATTTASAAATTASAATTSASIDNDENFKLPTSIWECLIRAAPVNPNCGVAKRFFDTNQYMIERSDGTFSPVIAIHELNNEYCVAGFIDVKYKNADALRYNINLVFDKFSSYKLCRKMTSIASLTK